MDLTILTLVILVRASELLTKVATDLADFEELIVALAKVQCCSRSGNGVES